MEQGIIPKDQTQVEVETLSGTRSVHPIWENGIFTKARVGMGKPVLSANEIPVNIQGVNQVIDHPIEVQDHDFLINCVSMGNPHAVAFVQTPVSQIPLEQIGPIVQNQHIFPEGINFEIVNVINKNKLEARVWERGTGGTMACGTGACAIAVISQLKGFSGDKVEISLPGGKLNVEWDGVHEVVLEGPITTVFNGEWHR
jgi:diaminopimelate epimerase